MSIIKSDRGMRRIAQQHNTIEPFEPSYKDRAGKYQGPRGVTLPKG